MNNKKKHRSELTNFKNALDNSAIVIITDRKGIITYVNKKFEEVSKYSKEEVMGQSHHILRSGYHPESFYKNIQNTITEGHVWCGDIKNVTKDGIYYWVRTTITPFLGDNGEPEQYIAVRTDITNQKEMEEKLQFTLNELKKADLLKEEFSSMVSHELKTPLTPLMGYCEMLLDQKSFGSLSETQVDYIKKISSNAETLQRLIGDVLDVQKLDMNRMSFNKQSFEAGTFMEKLKQDSEQLIKDKGIEFIVTDTVNTTLKTDQLRLRQVLDNLIRNAVDFVPSKNGKIEVGTTRESEKMIFHVKDNGIGISKDKQHYIFKKFYQVDTSHRRQHGGTGLGLVICKGIVQSLGGEIWFESEPGTRTEFSFSIPVNRGDLK